MADKKKKKKKVQRQSAQGSKNAQKQQATPVTAQTAPETEAVEVNKPAASAAPEKAAPQSKKPVQKKAKKSTKPGFFVRMGRKIREVFSELKKVTWPTFPTVLKQTGVVLAVVAFFLIFIFAIDSGFAGLFNLLFPVA